jgi:alkylhydroperoxidase family enzyme
MKDSGLDDRSILDAALVIAYFNFVNRLVLGLGVETEQEGTGGYIYDHQS